jgi:signal transduction histidine kinase
LTPTPDEPSQGLAAQAAQMASIFELCADGVALLDAAGRLLFANPACQALWGWDAGLPRPECLADFDDQLAACCLPDPGAADLSVAAQRSAAIADASSAERPVVLRLAHPRPCVLHRYLRLSGPGRDATALYFRDVTRAVDVDRLKSEFLSTAAHELRTPMASIYGCSELLLGRNLPPQQLDAAIGVIHRQAAQLMNLINELLDLASIQAGQGKDFQKKPVPVPGLIATALAACPTDPLGRALQCDVRHGQAHLVLDRDRTAQALVQVLSNAFKFSPAGGEVWLRTVERELAGQPQLGFQVTDQGIGMDSAQQARLFERFYRADPTGDIPGAGLGLSLVKEIVALQGGQVTVDSAPARGTRVTLWFDRPAAFTEAATPARRRAQAAGRKRT